MQYQLDGIDYTRPHFIHADLSPAELLKASQERGETPLTLGLGIAKDVLKSLNQVNRGQHGLMQRGFPKTGSEFLRMFAEVMVLENPEDSPSLQTVKPYLFDLRNRRVIQALEQSLKGGATDIAIFYGAAHMKDLARRIGKSQKVVEVDQKWLKAWDLNSKEFDQRIQTTLQSLQSLEVIQRFFLASRGTFAK
jgi:hypothetical protein